MKFHREYLTDPIGMYEESNLRLRVKVIRQALTADFETLCFMLEKRFFEYSCKMSEYDGKLQAYREMAFSAARPGRTQFGIRDRIFMHIKGTEEVKRLVKESYLARDNKYFYWPKDSNKK